MGTEGTWGGGGGEGGPGEAAPCSRWLPGQGPEIPVQASSIGGLPHKVHVGEGRWVDLHIAPALGNCSHSGRGPCRPATSGVSGGLWVPLEAVQSLRKAWAALRCARRWVMENPALPSSWDKITRTCLQDKADEDQWETRA